MLDEKALTEQVKAIMCRVQDAIVRTNRILQGFEKEPRPEPPIPSRGEVRVLPLLSLTQDNLKILEDQIVRIYDIVYIGREKDG